MNDDTRRLTRKEIFKVVYSYIGVSQGYLGDFSYSSHQQFYTYYCDLDIDPLEYPGTTRERFITILEECEPTDQAKILEGVLEKYPVLSSNDRTQELYDEIKQMIARLGGIPAVASPSPKITSEVVERAISDAETLLRQSGATSGVDRIHTALHGYLLAVCDRQGIEYGSNPSLTQLFKLIKTHHPALQVTGPRSGEIVQILRSFSAVLDALNPVRNRASVAHPNIELLGQDEAMLVINVSRTILHYLDAKLSVFEK